MDYKELGFKCGLEIHQRLNTNKKLFCECSTNEDGILEGKITRRQRAVAGELGSTDKSAIFEEYKNKEFIYNIFSKSSCLVDIDEEPPHQISREALEIALAISKALNVRLFDELQPMRKEVVDGSNTSAFQRTILLGYNGSIKVEGFPIPITAVSLEEESCGIAENGDKSTTYNVSRLGIPLIEIDTGPTIPNPEMAKKVALYIGMLLRITGKVKRGIGTIRQDVNVSIEKGSRIEIKGLQEVELMDKFIENEVIRQQRLVEIAEELRERNAKVGVAKEITKLLENTDAKLIADSISHGGIVMAFGLEGFGGLLGKEVGKNRRLGSEISDYAKAAGVRGLIHSDEDLNHYGFGSREIEEIKKELGHSFIMITGKRDTVEKAIELAKERAEYALVGVPAETRVAINSEDYATRFARPLPGGDRMYPETDIKPILLTEEMAKKAEENKPDLERELGSLAKTLKSEELAERMLRSQRYPIYKYVNEKSAADPVFIANELLQKFTELSRKGYDIEEIGQERLVAAFEFVRNKKITKQAFELLIEEMCKSDLSPEEVIKKNGLQRLSGKEIEEIIKSLKISDKERAIKEIMSKYKLNIDGEDLKKAIAAL